MGGGGVQVMERLSADGSSRKSTWKEACRGRRLRGFAAVSPGDKILEPLETQFCSQLRADTGFGHSWFSQLQVVAAPLLVGPGNLFLLFALLPSRAQEVLQHLSARGASITIVSNE